MGVLDLVGRKPQRLIVFVTAVLLLLSFSTYMTLSPTGYESVRTQIASIPHSWHRPGSGAGPSSASGIGSPAVDELAASPLAGMYTHNPGKPQNAQDMLKWATKGSDGNLYPPSFVPQMANTAPRAKAAFIVLVRNGEINNMRESMRDVEEKFNRKYGYPWVFLNSAYSRRSERHSRAPVARGATAMRSASASLAALTVLFWPLLFPDR